MTQITDDTKTKIQTLRAQGKSYNKIAEEVGVSVGTVTKYTKKTKLPKTTKKLNDKKDIKPIDTVAYLIAKNQVLQEMIYELINGKLGAI